MTNKKPLIIGHRGAPIAAGFENTLESFQKAIELGVDAVEMDIRKTNDNKIVVFHDSYISGRKLRHLTYKELNNFTSKQGFSVPLFEDIVELIAGKVKLDVEMKEKGYEEKVIDILISKLSYDDFIISSFNFTSLQNVKSLNSQIRTGLILGARNTFKLLHLRFKNASQKITPSDYPFNYLIPHWKIHNLRILNTPEFESYPKMIWTVNEEYAIRKLLNENVEGIITDDSEVAVQLQEKFPDKEPATIQ
ncbi:MAG: glycerophosphodiester phosphodiesterase [candidate division Zixibacteria bacterium]|nr:glycerophosphodiester phosphodiesterase [candidate division Zixibacteria bacterium]